MLSSGRLYAQVTIRYHAIDGVACVAILSKSALTTTESICISLKGEFHRYLPPIYDSQRFGSYEVTVEAESTRGDVVTREIKMIKIEVGRLRSTSSNFSLHNTYKI